MNPNALFPKTIQMLVHLAEHPKQQFSVEELAVQGGLKVTTARRILRALRREGAVSLTPGESGGWFIERPLREINLGQAYRASGVTVLPLLVGDSENEDDCDTSSAAPTVTAEISEVIDTPVQSSEEFGESVYEHTSAVRGEEGERKEGLVNGVRDPDEDAGEADPSFTEDPVHGAVNSLLVEAEELLASRFARVTLRDLLGQIKVFRTH